MITLDACGISCPEPLLMLKKALKTNDDILLLVDSKNALDNCGEFAQKKGFSVNTKEYQSRYEMRITTKK